MKLNRRRFLQALAATTTLATGLKRGFASAERHSRIIPSSGERIPAIGLGSWLVFAIDPDDETELTTRVAVIREFLKLGGGPETVAVAVERAITADRPRPRYVVTPSAHLFIWLRRILPDRAWDAVVGTVYPQPGR